jgi:hypothetical protein
MQQPRAGLVWFLWFPKLMDFDELWIEPLTLPLTRCEDSNDEGMYSRNPKVSVVQVPATGLIVLT